jgi:putative PIN family toxin of toxin-antitoxin system
MFVVIDTNILVSSFFLKDTAPAQVISLVLNGDIIPCIDGRLLAEYKEVLLRPKFHFSEEEVSTLITHFERKGISVLPKPIAIELPDKNDRMLLEISEQLNAPLITGNIRHFPSSENVVIAADFISGYLAAQNP